MKRKGVDSSPFQILIVKSGGLRDPLCYLSIWKMVLGMIVLAGYK